MALVLTQIKLKYGPTLDEFWGVICFYGWQGACLHWIVGPWQLKHDHAIRFDMS